MLQLYSVNHYCASASIREQFKLNPTELTELAQLPFIDGLVVNQTCNRVEILLDAPFDLETIIRAWWISKRHLETSHSKHIQSIKGDYLAAKYLAELSAGWHSLVKYDDQIHGQVKKAFIESLHNKWHSAHIERLFQCLMKIHKRLINETSIAKGSISLAYHTHQQIRKLVKHPAKLLIIGAGQMAQEIVKYIKKFDYSEITITNRTLQHASDRFSNNSFQFMEISEIQHYLNEYDVIINCIGTDILPKDFSIRSGQCMVDLSDNAILHRHTHNLPSAYLDLDYLSSLINHDQSDKDQLSAQIAECIQSSIQEFITWGHQYRLRRRA